jgi:hypothetical protein
LQDMKNEQDGIFNRTVEQSTVNSPQSTVAPGVWSPDQSSIVLI